MTQLEHRIAMWSGPRNISTALMRAWENRSDTIVYDEPFYACYLHETGLHHPGTDAIIAANSTDWQTVIAQITGPIPRQKPIWYQKHMVHHILPNMEIGWVQGLTNCFLIRRPREMINSYIKVRPDPTMRDLGIDQQFRIFDFVRSELGITPPVIAARDVLLDPRRQLSLLCTAIGVEFQESMLSWPAGPRTTDGVWAPYWYASVEASTGFAPYKAKEEPVPKHLRRLEAECEEIYREMWQWRLGNGSKAIENGQLKTEN